MKIIKGNIWNKWEEGKYIVIPTNCEKNSKGKAIMGAGMAKEAAIRVPELPEKLASFDDLNRVLVFNKHKLITFPTKNKWKENSILSMIDERCHDLNMLMMVIQDEVYLPQLGCGKGNLKWEVVQPVLEKHLKDDRFIVVE